MENKTGYINGSDLLLSVAGKAVGHCTTHTLSFNSETKDRSVKPTAATAASQSKWKGKGVTGLSVSVSAEGLRSYDESENGLKTLLAAWAEGKSVEVKAFERGNDTKPYLTGRFVITGMEETSPADDDVTYSINLENDGAVTLDATGITENDATE